MMTASHVRDPWTPSVVPVVTPCFWKALAKTHVHRATMRPATCVIDAQTTAWCARITYVWCVSQAMSCMTSYALTRLLLASILTIQLVGLALKDVTNAKTKRYVLLEPQTTTWTQTWYASLGRFVSGVNIPTALNVADATKTAWNATGQMTLSVKNVQMNFYFLKTLEIYRKHSETLDISQIAITNVIDALISV